MNRIEAARAAQRRALHPEESVWVAASAGTGKTKVLTDRLLALMLGGTDPAHILCLTFTRAAAAEMANRVNDRLARWTTMPPGALAQELVELTGRNPDDCDLALARQLFARVLDVPGGAKILTIHAFCQSLLEPLPAGSRRPAGIRRTRRTRRRRSARRGHRNRSSTRRGPNTRKQPTREPAGLAEALATVARHAPEERFAALMAEIAAERGKLRRALAGGETALRQRLSAALAVSRRHHKRCAVRGILRRRRRRRSRTARRRRGARRRHRRRPAARRRSRPLVRGTATRASA